MLSFFGTTPHGGSDVDDTDKVDDAVDADDSFRQARDVNLRSPFRDNVNGGTSFARSLSDFSESRQESPERNDILLSSDFERSRGNSGDPRTIRLQFPDPDSNRRSANFDPFIQSTAVGEGFFPVTQQGQQIFLTNNGPTQTIPQGALLPDPSGNGLLLPGLRPPLHRSPPPPLPPRRQPPSAPQSLPTFRPTPPPAREQRLTEQTSPSLPLPTPTPTSVRIQHHGDPSAGSQPEEEERVIRIGRGRPRRPFPRRQRPTFTETPSPPTTLSTSASTPPPTEPTDPQRFEDDRVPTTLSPQDVRRFRPQQRIPLRPPQGVIPLLRQPLPPRFGFPPPRDFSSLNSLRSPLDDPRFFPENQAPPRLSEEALQRLEPEQDLRNNNNRFRQDQRRNLDFRQDQRGNPDFRTSTPPRTRGTTTTAPPATTIGENSIGSPTPPQFDVQRRPFQQHHANNLLQNHQGIPLQFLPTPQPIDPGFVHFGVTGAGLNIAQNPQGFLTPNFPFTRNPQQFTSTPPVQEVTIAPGQHLLLDPGQAFTSAPEQDVSRFPDQFSRDPNQGHPTGSPEASRFPEQQQVSRFPEEQHVSRFPEQQQVSRFPEQQQISRFPEQQQVSRFPEQQQVSRFPEQQQVSRFPEQFSRDPSRPTGSFEQDFRSELENSISEEQDFQRPNLPTRNLPNRFSRFPGTTPFPTTTLDQQQFTREPTRLFNEIPTLQQQQQQQHGSGPFTGIPPQFNRAPQQPFTLTPQGQFTPQPEFQQPPNQVLDKFLNEKILREIQAQRKREQELAEEQLSQIQRPEQQPPPHRPPPRRFTSTARPPLTSTSRKVEISRVPSRGQRVSVAVSKSVSSTRAVPRPIREEEDQRRPIREEEDRRQSFREQKNQRRPPFQEEENQRGPIRDEENQRRPISEEENQRRPIREGEKESVTRRPVVDPFAESTGRPSFEKPSQDFRFEQENDADKRLHRLIGIPQNLAVEQQRRPQAFTANELESDIKRPSKETTSKPKKSDVVGILSYFMDKNEDGTFTYGYETEDGTFKEETRGKDCVVRGRYGYIDPTGKRREYSYEQGNPCDPEEEARNQDDGSSPSSQGFSSEGEDDDGRRRETRTPSDQKSKQQEESLSQDYDYFY